MLIKMTLKREVNIDLNAYYDSFPRQLRASIDEAVFDLLGADKSSKGAKPQIGSRYDLSTQVRLTKKVPRAGTVLRMIFEECQKKYPNGGTYAQLLAVCKDAGRGNALPNMITQKNAEIVRGK